jgi:hypothetical protein
VPRPKRHRTLQVRCLPSPCGRLSRPRTTTTARPHPRPNSRQRACSHRAGSRRMVPTFIADRSTGAAPSFPPAASPRVRRRPSSWPPRQPRNTGHGVAHPTGAGVHCSSAHIRQVGADAALEGVQSLVRFRYTFPSRLPDSGRLAVPARPVVVGAAPIRTLRFQGQAAPSFSNPLRWAAVGSFIPLGHSTPRGALRAPGTAGPVAGAATRKHGLAAHRANGLPDLRSSKEPLVPERPNLRPGPDTPVSDPQAESSWQEKQRRVHQHMQVLADVLTRADDFGRPGVLAAVAPRSGTAAAP